MQPRSDHCEGLADNSVAMLSVRMSILDCEGHCAATRASCRGRSIDQHPRVKRSQCCVAMLTCVLQDVVLLQPISLADVLSAWLRERKQTCRCGSSNVTAASDTPVTCAVSGGVYCASDHTAAQCSAAQRTRQLTTHRSPPNESSLPSMTAPRLQRRWQAAGGRQ
jgi:hypothetical protein